jgi:tetratricopeptide (TPR) repeat protein
VTKNRRDGLKSKKPELKLENAKELAYIRLLEGQISFALNDIDTAIDSYNKARSTLANMSDTSYALNGLIDYQFGAIAKYYKEHDKVVELISTSANNLSLGGRHGTAIKNLFDLLDYIEVNKIDADPFTFTDQIDQITRKKIDDKDDRKVFSAELSLVKGKLNKLKNPKDAKRDFENAAKEFSKLKLYNKHSEAQVLWAELIRNDSFKKSEKLLKEAVEIAKKGDVKRVLGLAQVSFAKNKRIIKELDEAKSLEKEGFELLDNSDNKLETAEYYLEMSRVIALTSTNDNELKTGVDYATKASKLFDEIDHKYGKTVALFMQGFNRVAKGFQEGLSTVKLTFINLKRLRKNDQIVAINSNASYLVNSLNTGEGDEVIPMLENTSQDLHPLEEGSLYHLAGVLRYQTSKEEGIKLITQSLKYLEKYVKKNKEFRLLLDVAEERAQNMQQDMPISSEQQQTSEATTPASPPIVPKPNAKQSKIKTKGGPDLGKK